MRNRITLLGPAAALIALILASAPSTARADDDPNLLPRLHLKGVFGVAGNAKVDGLDGRRDLDTSYGGAAEIEVPLVQLLSLGAEAMVVGWRTKAAKSYEFDRNVLIDLSAVPRLRLPFDGEAVFGAFYVGVPIGFTIHVLDDSYNQALNLVGTDVKTGFGWNIGGRGGVQLFVSPRVGLVGEVEYRYHWIHHGVDGPVTSPSDEKLKIQQLYVHAGLVFIL